MPSNIDYDRGCIIKMDQNTGIKVFMYVDDPGVYLSKYGTPVAEDLARAAGFDVERLAKAHAKKVMVSDAIKAIEADAQLADGFEPRVVAKAGPFHLIAANPFGGHVVEAVDGTRLTPFAMPKEQALALIQKLAPTAVVEEVKEGDDNPEVTEATEPEQPKRPRARSFADA